MRIHPNCIAWQKSRAQGLRPGHEYREYLWISHWCDSFHFLCRTDPWANAKNHSCLICMLWIFKNSLSCEFSLDASPTAASPSQEHDLWSTAEGWRGLSLSLESSAFSLASPCALFTGVLRIRLVLVRRLRYRLRNLPGSQRWLTWYHNSVWQNWPSNPGLLCRCSALFQWSWRCFSPVDFPKDSNACKSCRVLGKARNFHTKSLLDSSTGNDQRH